MVVEKLVAAIPPISGIDVIDSLPAFCLILYIVDA